jgi:hypothetical protein
MFLILTDFVVGVTGVVQFGGKIHPSAHMTQLSADSTQV